MEYKYLLSKHSLNNLKILNNTYRIIIKNQNIVISYQKYILIERVLCYKVFVIRLIMH